MIQTSNLCLYYTRFHSLNQKSNGFMCKNLLLTSKLLMLKMYQSAWRYVRIKIRVIAMFVLLFVFINLMCNATILSDCRWTIFHLNLKDCVVSDRCDRFRSSAKNDIFFFYFFFWIFFFCKHGRVVSALAFKKSYLRLNSCTQMIQIVTRTER